MDRDLRAWKSGLCPSLKAKFWVGDYINVEAKRFPPNIRDNERSIEYRALQGLLDIHAGLKV